MPASRASSLGIQTSNTTDPGWSPERHGPSTGEWTIAPLVALDLEGSGAQARGDEAILEIALVPLAAGQPDAAAAYTTLINPGRPIPRRPWMSPGLTTAGLAVAPAPAQIEPELGPS